MWKRLLENFVKFGRSYKIIGVKIVLRDWGLRDVGSIFMFDDDSEFRGILRLTIRSIPEVFVKFRWVTEIVDFGVPRAVPEKVPFCRFLSFSIPAFDLRRARNSMQDRLKKSQIRSPERFPANSWSWLSVERIRTDICRTDKNGKVKSSRTF